MTAVSHGVDVYREKNDHRLRCRRPRRRCGVGDTSLINIFIFVMFTIWLMTVFGNGDGGDYDEELVELIICTSR